MTCALTILINFRLPLKEPNYLGDFDDFTPAWFKSIGYSLGLTLLLKIITCLLLIVIKKLITGLPRWWDRCLGCDMAVTKKKTHTEYEKLYTNPEFTIDFSYTEVINVVFVCMTLSPLLPYIFFIGYIYLIAIYWRDKYLCSFSLLVLTNSRIPPHFDESISKKSRGILTAVIPIYLILCIWIFGNNNLIENSSDVPLVPIEGSLI